MKLIQISDTHLSAKKAYAQNNFEAVLRYIHEAKPDLVIHTGDIVLDDPDDLEDLEYGWLQLHRILCPFQVIPGGHDLGDSPPEPWMGQYITEERRRQYLDKYQVDRWSLRFGAWKFIGLNCQLFESGLAEEERQWDYLEDELHHSIGMNTALFFHKPPCNLSFDETVDTVSFIPTSSRERLKNLLAGSRVQLICTGHRHRYLTFKTFGVTVVSAPTTGLLSEDDDYLGEDGVLRNGIVEYIFDPNGFRFRLVEPPGVAFIHYPNLDPSIPRGSRFLPPYHYEEQVDNE